VRRADAAAIFAEGKAMQVDPIKPTLQASGIKFLKPRYGKPLSQYAFKFKLRRYKKAGVSVGHPAGPYTHPLYFVHLLIGRFRYIASRAER
jgi:hypothetical protein